MRPDADGNTIQASVIIPVKNGGKRFCEVLDVVVAQKAPWPFEVLIVDSGSTDGSAEYARGKGVAVQEIAPESFGHGRTRNFAISLTTGAYVAILTQDALPASDQWLVHLVDAVSAAPDIAGCFGRHLPYPEADPYTAMEITRHFDSIAAGPNVVRNSDPERYRLDAGYRQSLHFFSDNNACIRRSVWKALPYPDVDYAEDQAWAKLAIEAGYSKAFANDAEVFHSHTYTLVEILRRSYDESRALNKLFGYVLCRSTLQCAKRAIGLSLRDVVFTFRRRSVKQDWKWMLRAPFAETARQIGHYLGARNKRLPVWAANWLSLDRSRRGA